MYSIKYDPIFKAIAAHLVDLRLNLFVYDLNFLTIKSNLIQKSLFGFACSGEMPLKYYNQSTICMLSV